MSHEHFQAVEIPEKLVSQVESGQLASRPAEDLIKWGLESFAPGIALSASFGSPEGMVILDLMHKINPSQTRVFAIDTGRLPQETYNLMDRVRERYDIQVEVFFPRPERVEAMVRQHGLNLFFESRTQRETCCEIRKVDPLHRALEGLDAWLSGLRSDQSRERRSVRPVEIDQVHGGRVKLNPLAGWTRQRVWDYVHAHSVPTNALHAQNYPSVGCAPCSRAVQEGEDERAGRWWWESDSSKECGIHTGYEEEGSGI